MPSAIDAFTGDIVIEVRAAAVTLKFVDPLTPLELAATLAVPAPVLVPRPVVFTLNTVVSLELHVALLVRSCTLPSVNVPVAVNCWVVPSATDAFAGEMTRELRAAAVTVRVLAPVTDADAAAITVCPVPMLLASPLVTGALLMVATLVAFELHVTVPVMSCVLPSVYKPVAVN